MSARIDEEQLEAIISERLRVSEAKTKTIDEISTASIIDEIKAELEKLKTEKQCPDEPIHNADTVPVCSVCGAATIRRRIRSHDWRCDACKAVFKAPARKPRTNKNRVPPALKAIVSKTIGGVV